MLNIGDYAITVPRRNPFYKGGQVVKINFDSEYPYDLKFPDGYGCNYKESELQKVNSKEECYNDNL